MSVATATATPAAESVATALSAHPDGITARDLATAAGVGASTAAKTLVAMETAGTATRTPGPANGNRKPADLWRPATTPEETTMTATTDASTAHEAPVTDDASTADEAPATDDASTADEAPATDDASTADEAPVADDASTADDGSKRIVESHMAKPGQTVHFGVSGEDVTNTGDREAAIFLTAGGKIVADVPVTVTARKPVSGAKSGNADHFKIVMVAGILGDYPNGVAAAVITDQSGLRAPVVARVLMAMEVAGAAVRKPGGPNKEDTPDRWVRGDAALNTVDLANATPYRECTCSCGHTHRVKNGVTVTATARRTTASGRTTGEINTDGTPKLGKNGLRNQVEAFMRDLGPGHDVTPGTVGRELGGRSSGACGNAMDKLSATGVLMMTSTAPVKYALGDDAPAPTAEVAALMTSTPVSDDEADNATDDATGNDAAPVVDSAETADNATDDATADDATPVADSAEAAGDDTDDTTADDANTTDTESADSTDATADHTTDEAPTA
jgi:hypothetical protein